MGVAQRLIRDVARLRSALLPSPRHREPTAYAQRNDDGGSQGKRRRPIRQHISAGNWRRAEPGRLGEAKQDRPSGLLDGKLLPESARIPGNIARLPMRAGTQQLSARRTIPAPLLIRYCGAEVSRILPAVDMVLAVFEALHRSVAISAHLFRAALADIGKAPPKSARGRAPRARCQSG